MIVAELVVHVERGFGGAIVNVAKFDSLDKAKAEFDRVADLLKQRADRKNDLPKLLEVVGCGSQFSLPLDDVCSVALCDYALSNEQETGVKDAFPLLFKR